MEQILHIVKYKLISFLKIKLTFTPGVIIKNAGTMLVYSAFAFASFLFSYSVTQYLIEVLHIGLFLFHEFVSIILFIFFISVNVGNIVVSYSTLYKSAEVNFLFTKPVKSVKIFLIKFTDNFFYSSSTLLLILISVLAGYSYYFKLSVTDIGLLFFFNFIPFMITAAALGIIVLLLIIRLSVFIGTKPVLGILTVFYLGSLFFFFNLSSPVELVNRVMEYYPNVDRYFSDLIPAVIQYLPNHWLAESMYWFSRDIHSAAWSYFYLQIVAALLLSVIAGVLGAKWYYKTWFYDFSIRSYNSRKQSRFFPLDKDSSFSPSTEVVIKKEYFTFFRESSQVFHLSVLFILILIFLTSVSSLINMKNLNIFMQTVIYLSVFIFNTFLVSTLSLRFVFPLVSLEGLTFWRIKSAPVNIKKYLFTKLIPYLLFIIIVSLILNTVVNIQFPVRLLLFSSVVTLISAVSLVMINFGMGSYFAVFKEKNPIRIASSQGASLSFLINILYMIILVSILFYPINEYFTLSGKTDKTDISSLLTAAVLITTLSVMIFSFFYITLTKSLKRDF